MRVVSSNNTIDIDRGQEYQIEFSNSIGVVFFEHILLPKYNDRVPIYLKSIERIKLVKKKNFILNVFCFINAAIFFTILSFYAKSNLEISLLFALGSAFLFASFRVNKSNYTLVITKSNLDFIELKLDKKYKDEAKKIIRMVEKKSKHLTRTNNSKKA